MQRNVSNPQHPREEYSISTMLNVYILIPLWMSLFVCVLWDFSCICSSYAVSRVTMLNVKIAESQNVYLHRTTFSAFFVSVCVCVGLLFFRCFVLFLSVWNLWALGSLMATTNQNTKIMYSNKNGSGSIWSDTPFYNWMGYVKSSNDIFKMLV